MDFRLSPNEKYDKKWGSVDIQAVLDYETLPSLWFGLVECHEVAVDAEVTEGNCSKLDFSKKVDSSESKGVCFSEENKNAFYDATNADSSSAIFNSWLWKHTSDMKLVEQCLTSAMTKQRKLTNKLLSDTLPFCYLKQQLLLTERVYIAMQKNNVMSRDLPGKKEAITLPVCSKGERNAEIQSMSGDPTQCLAQVGSRAILSFAFAFLKRAWRSGEDGDLCSDLLKEALDIFRCLPVATFFNESCYSGVWIEVIEKSKNFFASVAKGEITGGSGMSSQQPNCLPIKDRQIALFLYLELSLLQGTLPAILDAVLFMIQLSALCYCQDNQTSKGLFFSPLIPFLKRFSDAISQHRDSLPCENVDEDDKVKHNYLTTSNAFLKYLELPGDASVMINLKDAAIICMCHLDFLACKYLKEYANTNMNFDCRQEFISFGQLSFLNSHNFASLISEVVDDGNVKQIVCSRSSLLLLTHCGLLYMLNLTKNSKFQRISSEVKKFVDIASHWKADHFLAVSSDGSAFSWGKGNSGQLGQGTDSLCLKVPTQIKSLSGKFIRKISCNGHYSAFISDVGELYICGGSPRKLMSDDICVPMLVPLPDKVVDVACETPDSPFIACCNGGLYTVTKKTRNFQTTFNHEFCTSMAHVEITKISVGTDGLVAAVSKLGQLYLWNSSSEESKLFRVLAEKSIAVDDIVSLNFGARVTDVCFTENQLLVLLESGQVLYWNDDGSEDKSDGDGCFIPGADYRRHRSTLRSNGLKFIGINCAADQSFAWTTGTSLFVPMKKEFLVDLKAQTFDHLNNLLSIICDSIGGHQNWPPSQDEECLAVSSLNLLNLQLRCIISCKAQENTALLHNADLLASLKQKVIILASNRGVLTSIQEAAQAVLCGGWQVLAPSHKERSKLLTSLLTQKRNVNGDEQSTGLSPGETFMIELLINSLMSGSELESCVGSLFLVSSHKLAHKVVEIPPLVPQPNSKSKSDMINMTRSQESVKDSKNSLLQQATMFSNFSRFQLNRDRNQSDVPTSPDDADGDGDDDDDDNDDASSIMHLLELLLCNLASEVKDRLKNSGNNSTDRTGKLESTRDLSSLVKFLLKFQRLFFTKTLDIYGDAEISFCPEPDVTNASCQLKKYVDIVCHSVSDVLQKVSDGKVSGSVNSTVEKDFVGVALQELVLSLLLLESKNPSIVHFAGLDETLISLLEKLNRYVKSYTEYESEDDGGSWSNPWIHDLKRQRGQRKAQFNVVCTSDLENLLKEGCLWVRDKQKVYDLKQLTSLLDVDEENLKQYIGKLSSDAIWPGFYNINFVKKLESCIIGYYNEGDAKEKKNASFSDPCSPLVHCLRMLSLLIGMQARKKFISTELSDSEVECSDHLKLSFLYGGLDTEDAASIRDCSAAPAQDESHKLHHKTCRLKREDDLASDGEKPTTNAVGLTKFINSYLSSSESSHDVQKFQEVIKSYCSSHSLFLPAAFAQDHPLSETTRFVISVLLRHLDLWEDVQEVLRSDVYSKQPSALPESLVNVCKIVCQAKKILVKVHQDSGTSYKEVCSAVLERCKFLLFEVKPGLEADWTKPSTNRDSHRQTGSRWERAVEKLSEGRKMRVTRRSRNAETNEERNTEPKKSDKNCHQKDDSYFSEDDKLEVKDDKFSQWSHLLYMFKSLSSYKRLLICDTMEFLLNQENINIDLLRQALLNQSVRAATRLKGLQNMTSLLRNSSLTSISIFNVLFGWQGFLEKKQIELPLCLANIDLAPHSEKVKLEQTFDELNSWLVCKLRETLLNVELEAADLRAEEKTYLREEASGNDVLEKVQIKHSLGNKRRGSLPTCSQLFLNAKETTSMDETFGDFDVSLEIPKTSSKLKTKLVGDRLTGCSERTSKGSEQSERGKLEQYLPSSRYASLLISILTTQHSKSSLENIINSGILPLARTAFRLLVNESEIEDGSSRLDDERDFQALVDGFLDDREAIYSTFDGLKTTSALKVGSRVVRGPNWNWEEQDGPQPGIGTVMSELDEDGWVRVEWDTGSSHLYRMGKDNKYDLKLYEGLNHSTYLNKAKEEIHAYLYKRSLLSDSNCSTSPLNSSFCNIVTNLMNCLCLNVLVLKDQQTLNYFTASNFACHLRHVIDSSYAVLRKDDCQEHRGRFKFMFHGCHADLNHWAGFGFVRSISSNFAVSKELARFHWINKLLEFLTSKDVSLMQKLQILLLLEVVLPQYDEPVKMSKMKLIVHHLIEILGSLAASCPYDMSLRNNDLLAFCNRKMSKTFHLLSASHTSSIAEQLRSLLASLHKVPSWTAVINEHVLYQLNTLSDFLITREECGDVPGEGGGGFQLLGVLAFLGGVDETKLRLGGRVCHEEFGEGTVAGININGDVSVQFDQNIHPKSCYYKELVVNQISLGDLFGESTELEPWAKMLYSALCLSTFYKDCDDPTSSHLEQPIGDEPGKSHQRYSLQSFVLRFFLLKSVRVLLNNQQTTRKVLSSNISQLFPTKVKRSCHGSDVQKVFDQFAEGDSSSSQAVSIFQRIIQLSTQPCPIRPNFDLHDIQLALVSLFQALASGAFDDVPQLGGSFPVATQAASAEDVPLLANDRRNNLVFDLCKGSSSHDVSPLWKRKKYFATEISSPRRADEFDDCEEEGGATGGNFHNSFHLVQQLMDMGFSQKKIHCALRELASSTCDESPLVEAAVTWLLEHEDDWSSSVDDGPPLDPEMFRGNSEERQVGELAHDAAVDEDSSTVTKARFLTKENFQDSDSYASYVKDNIKVGMIVKCCRAYDDVRVGVHGVVEELDSDGLHDLNVRVDWSDREGRSYWTQYGHIDLNGDREAGKIPDASKFLLAEEARENDSLKIGDRVRVKQSVQNPFFGWGLVNHSSVGTITGLSISGMEATVNFNQQSAWNGLISELEVASFPVPPHSTCQVSPCRKKLYQCSSTNSEISYPTSIHSRNSRNEILRLQNVPQSLEKHEMLLNDWKKCIKSVQVSSGDDTALYLFGSKGGYWQSCGMMGKHWIRLEMHENVLVDQLMMTINPCDSNYVPSLVCVTGGSSPQQCNKELKLTRVSSHDVDVTLLENVNQFYKFIEIQIRQCNNEGIDCRVHSIDIVGRLCYPESIETFNHLSYLASDYNLEDSSDAKVIANKSKLVMNSRDVQHTFVFVWGLNDKDQLGGPKGSKIKIPVLNEILSSLKCVQIAGGSKSLFCVTQDGKLYSSGEATNGRLGLGLSSGHVTVPRQLTSLGQYVIKKVAVHSGGRHAMALTVDGKVFSWGEGDDGKLGHFSSMSCEKPKLIEALRSKRVRDIACGSSHSAAIISNGELYTWGLGEYGRLGHGDSNTQKRPKLVVALSGQRVVQVSLGSRDAQTLALTDEGTVYSWGDGDFGKLGRGGSEGCNVPQVVEKLNNLGVCQVECGAQFSLALTKSGQVWTWGKGDYFRLGHGSDGHVRKPQLVDSLKDKKIVHVAVGALHCLAVTDFGKVYAWGDNDHGQQGNGTTAVNKKPVLVHGLDGYKIAKVSCGSSHSVAWCTTDVPYSCSYEPVTFFPSQDPLGAALSAGGSSEDNDLEDYNKSGKSESFASSQKLSLAHIILSLDTRLDKLQAVSHLMRGLQIYYARMTIIEAVKPTNEASSSLSKKLSTSSSSDGCKDYYSPLISPLESPPPPPASHLARIKLPSLSLISTISKPSKKSTAASLGEINVSSKELNSASSDDVFKTSFKSLDKFKKARSADIPEGDILRVSSNSCPEFTSSQKTIETVGLLSKKHPSTLPSLLLSRSDDGTKSSGKFFPRSENLQVGDGSEDCSTSVPPDNFVAAFSECDEGVKESYTPKTDSPTTPGPDCKRAEEEELDEFTTELSVDDARMIVDLLKFAAAGRVCRQAQNVLSRLLNNLAKFNVQVSEMLLELCVTELEDVSVNTFPGSKSSPVVQESPHPYVDNSNLSGTVRISGADSLRVQFDRQCSTERRHDHLTIMDSNMKILSVRSGREFCNWSQELIVPGDELHWQFRSDGSVNGWGWKFTVYRVSSEFPGRDHSLSDRTLISRPSIHLVMSLLDFKLPHSNDRNIILRLAAALAACSQITSLGSSQKIWILKKLRTLMTSHFGKNINIRLVMSNPSHEMSNCSSFVQLVKRLPETLLRQFEYEDPIVRSGKQLTFSRFFKVLVGLACDLGLDSFLSLSEQQNQKWGWFHKYCLATRVACSLQERTELPSAFCDEVLRKIRELSEEDEVVDRTHEDQKMFTMAHDEQLLLWLNRKPDDWVLTSESSGQIWVWGHNHRGQLGGVEGAKIKVPLACEALTVLRPVQIVGGEQTLFAVTADGKVYASGYGAGGRLGIGSTESVSVLALLESIQHVHVKKVSVNSGGKHCLALTSDGDVFSWGEGEDGKLGHGSKTFCDRPRVIETLRGKDIIDVAAGGAHSACISARGELYTWGKGRYGRLGHGDGEDQLKPKLVEFLKDYRVIDVACGSGDAQTLCLTGDDSVWSWGDGDYGKLGRGGSEGCKVPMKIESLQGLGVVNVECGSQFSVALTRTGSVYTWGKGDYHRLGHGSDDHVRKPKRILSLQGKKIVSIACGSLHCVCCTDTGEVYTWGDNDEGQLGDGSMVAIQKPRIVMALQGKKINKLACGSAHSFAWSSNKPNYSNKLPQEIPMEFNLLQNINPRTFRNRLILLHHFSDVFCPCISMIELDCGDELGTFADVPRGLLALSAKESVFRKVVQATMVRDKPHGPVIEINRIQVKRSRNKGGLAGIDGMKSVFGQICLRMGDILPDSLMLPHRVWKVKFIGESVDDCGGGYSESIAEICDELQNGSVGLLIQTPNGRDEAGTNRDCFVLNPNYNSSLHRDMFKFFGMLLGIAIRTGSPLNLNLAEPVWKQLVGLPLSLTDFDDIDRDFVPGLMHLKDMDRDSLKLSEMPYSTTNSAATEIKLGNKFQRIDQINRMEYIKQALTCRLHEFDEQVDCVRRGMSLVIPVPLLSLFTGLELETMVCGSPDIPVNLLKSVATYKGIEPTTDLIQWFWEVMEDFTNVERSLFLRFVWGRTRLPRTIADFRGRDFVIQVLDRYDPPDNFLPESYTCFFLLKMPKYSSKKILKEKLKYAIHFCKSIDTDDYARIALASPHLDTESSNDADNDEDAISFNNQSDGATSSDED